MIFEVEIGKSVVFEFEPSLIFLFRIKCNILINNIQNRNAFRIKVSVVPSYSCLDHKLADTIYLFYQPDHVPGELALSDMIKCTSHWKTISRNSMLTVVSCFPL